ncbi:MAG: hypothetical protein ACYDBB_18745, partial [Armatimonadota bacterium]
WLDLNTARDSHYFFRQQEETPYRLSRSFGRDSPFHSLANSPTPCYPVAMTEAARKPRRWKRGVLVVALVLLVAGGVWWWRMPRQMKLVARIPGLVVATCDGGFVVRGTVWRNMKVVPQPNSGDPGTHITWLTRQSSTRYRCHDWRTGQERWHCELFQAANGIYQPAISPDGHYFAVLAQYGAGLRVHTWKDGAPVGDAPLPVTVAEMAFSSALYGLRMFNSGRIICWRPVKNGWKLEAVEGNRVVAQGVVPDASVRFAGLDERFPELSLDGARFLAPVGYISSPHGGKPVSAHCWTITERKSQLIHTPYVIPSVDEQRQGFILNGSRIDAAGYVSGNAVPGLGIPLFVQGSSVLYYTPMTATGPAEHIVITNAATGNKWQLFPPRGMGFGHFGPLTPDGQYVLLRYADQHPLARLPESVRKRLYRWPKLRDYLFSVMQHDADDLLLYERPGKLRAVCSAARMRSQITGYQAVNPIAFSPDGHAVLMPINTTNVSQVSTEDHFFVCLLRW